MVEQLSFDPYYFGVATNPDAKELVGIVKPTSIPLSLTPLTRVTPIPFGLSTDVYFAVLVLYTKPCEAPDES